MTSLSLHFRSIYSETCVIRPPLLSGKTGLATVMQVVIEDRFKSMFRQVQVLYQTKVVFGHRMVFPERWSLTQVSLYVAVLSNFLNKVDSDKLFECFYLV